MTFIKCRLKTSISVLVCFRKIDINELLKCQCTIHSECINYTLVCRPIENCLCPNYTSRCEGPCDAAVLVVEFDVEGVDPKCRPNDTCVPEECTSKFLDYQAS